MNNYGINKLKEKVQAKNNTAIENVVDDTTSDEGIEDDATSEESQDAENVEATENNEEAVANQTEATN